MKAGERQLRVYITSNGRKPFVRWLAGLKDRHARARIEVRLERLESGNFGSIRRLAGGIAELKIHYGPGYRVYFGEDGSIVVILLSGGTKKLQTRDVKRAVRYWKDYLKRKESGRA